MKKIIFFVCLISFCSTTAMAQVSQATLEKREKRKNLTIKEWNESAATKTRFMDRKTVYDAAGRKIEETEYANYGQKWKIVYEYNALGQCYREVEYDGRNKVVRIRKYDFYSDGSKKKQYNYLPNGKLETVKEFEYIFNK